MAAKRHHYLPQFYLDAWVPADTNTFAVCDKDGGATRAQTPLNTGVEGHLYTLLTDEGAPTDVVETDVLGPLDSAAAPAVERLIQPEPELRPDDRMVLAEFLAASHARTPRQIAIVKELYELAHIRGAQDLARDSERFAEFVRSYNRAHPDQEILDASQLREVFMDLEEQFSVSIDSRFAMLKSLQLTGEYARHLASMHWTLVEPIGDEVFYTSDAPLVLLLPRGGGEVSFGTGFADPQVEVSFPLSPTRCLYMTPQRDVSVPEVPELNRRLVAQAERFVISSSPSPELASLVEKFAFTRTLPKLDRSEVLARPLPGLEDEDEEPPAGGQ